MRSIQARWWYGPGLIGAVGALLAVLSSHSAFSAQPASAGEKIARAERISIEGGVEHPKSLTLADLKREPATSEVVSLKAGKGILTGTYTGVLLWTLLQEATIKVSPENKNEIIRHTILVTSSDGYATVLSAAEIDPQLGGEHAIIAYAKDGQPLTNKRGFARLILPADKSAARAVSGVTRITVQ